MMHPTVNLTCQCWSATAGQQHILGGKLGFKHDAPGQWNYFGGKSNEQPIPKSFSSTEYIKKI